MSLAARETKWAYYNEWDSYAAQWIRNLVRNGHLPDGEIDERSITDVQPDDLRGFRQVHLFCGIGGWPLALKIAGWSEDKEIWTGSCPCQPFSGAGKRKGTADERHLWPHMARLILARRPAVVMGEQVDKRAGYDWLDGVRSDLEAEAFEVRGVDIPAASVNSPHKRNRIVWIARRLPNAARIGSGSGFCEARSIIDWHGVTGISGGDGRLSNSERSPGRAEHEHDARERQGSGTRDGAGIGKSGQATDHVEQLGFTFSARSQGHAGDGDRGCEPGRIGEGSNGSIAEAGSGVSGMGDGDGDGLQRSEPNGTSELRRRSPDECGESCVCLADTRRGFVSQSGRGSEGRDGAGSGSAVPCRDAGAFWNDYAIVGPDPKGKYRRVGRNLPGIEKVIEGSVKSPVCQLADGISEGMAGVRAGEEGAAEIQTEGWGTPRVTNNGGIPSPEVTGRGSRLEDQAAELHGWSSPTSLSFADSHQPGNSRNMNAIRDVAISVGVGDHIPLLGIGIPARVGKLKGFGNAIVPGMCAQVIMAFMEAEAMADQWGDCGK